MDWEPGGRPGATPGPLLIPRPVENPTPLGTILEWSLLVPERDGW